MLCIYIQQMFSCVCLYLTCLLCCPKIQSPADYRGPNDPPPLCRLVRAPEVASPHMQLVHSSLPLHPTYIYLFCPLMPLSFDQSLAALQKFLDYFAAANTAALTEKFDSGAFNSSQSFTAPLQHQRLFPQTLFSFRLKSSVYKSLW